MDSRIIALLQKRNEGALNAIRTEYGGLCFRIAENILGNAQDAEECVSDVLLAVWNSIPPQHPESLEAYVVTLTRHNAVSMLRAKKSLKRGGREFVQALEELNEAVPSGFSVEETVDRRALTDLLTRWLRTLEPVPQRIFMQRYYLSESVQSIAAENNMRVSAVKMTLHRLRKRLKAFLREEDYL